MPGSCQPVFFTCSTLRVTVVVVVSEETGQISIAMAGKLTRNYNRVTLREVLERELIGSPEDASGSKRILGKLGFGSGTARRGE